jgi:hypothetical protein
MTTVLRDTSVMLTPTLVREYRLYKPGGDYWFSKLRYTPKAFCYGRDGHRSRKPQGADEILYVGDRTPGRLTHEDGYAISAARWEDLDTAEPVHQAEGEQDADTLASQGFQAVSCHQGAGKATLAQAQLLLPFPEVVIWMDKDGTVGAYDAWLRHNRLCEAGYEGEIRIVRAWGKRNKDVTDQVRAGIPVRRAVRVNRSWLAKAAAEEAERRASGRRGKYGY